MVLKSAEHSSVMADSFLKSDNQQMNKLIKKTSNHQITYWLFNRQPTQWLLILKETAISTEQTLSSVFLKQNPVARIRFFWGGGMPIEC